MVKVDTRMVEAWREASADLGIRLTSPFMAAVDDGEPIELEGFLQDFGGPSGMVVISFQRRVKRLKAGVYVSVLSRDYQKYRRGLFIDTLNDWGWFAGQDRTPSWYTGQPWS